jgi:hypothetical protein
MKKTMINANILLMQSFHPKVTVDFSDMVLSSVRWFQTAAGCDMRHCPGQWIDPYDH